MSLSLSRIISVIAFWGGEGDRFWDVGVRSLLGCGRAIAKRCCKQFAVLGRWGCDSASADLSVRFWDVGGR